MQTSVLLPSAPRPAHDSGRGSEHWSIFDSAHPAIFSSARSPGGTCCCCRPVRGGGRSAGVRRGGSAQRSERLLLASRLGVGCVRTSLRHRRCLCYLRPTGLVHWYQAARVLHMRTLPPEPVAQSGARPPPRTAAHLLAGPRGCSSGSARRGISTRRTQSINVDPLPFMCGTAARATVQGAQGTAQRAPSRRRTPNVLVFSSCHRLRAPCGAKSYAWLSVCSRGDLVNTSSRDSLTAPPLSMVAFRYDDLGSGYKRTYRRASEGQAPTLKMHVAP